VGVSLSYFTTDPMHDADRRGLFTDADAKNRGREWWCEGIWICDKSIENRTVFGSTKLFCMIDDEDTDTYMAYLDICEIVEFLAGESKRRGHTWWFEIEGESFGRIRDGVPDVELRGNLESFLEVFPGDFESLRRKSREQILAAWADR